MKEPPMTIDLSAIDSRTLVALAAGVAKEAKSRRDDLDVGVHAVEEVVAIHVSGAIVVGEPETYTPTVDIPTKLAFALFVEYSGITGPHAMAALTKAMNEAAAIGQLKGKARKEKEAAIRSIKSLADAEATVLSGLDALDEKTRRGKVLSKGVSLTALGDDPETVAA